MEEYPLSEEYITEGEEGNYIFDGWVSSFEGVGRFVLGLMDEVEIIVPGTLKKYLNKRIAGKKF